MKKSYQKPQIKVTKIKATEKKVRTAKADGVADIKQSAHYIVMGWTPI